MGQIAAKTFPSFLQTIQKLDNVLGRLYPAPPFRLVDLVRGDIETISPNINEADIAQPFCTAVQIALVDFLAEWGVTPVVSVGHSSGEIAAAYAAGLLSAPKAMFAAYCRGQAVREYSNLGSMLAIGVGADALDEYLAPYASEQLCIACENSPSSVTLSGMSHCIQDIKEKLDADKVFARELKTGRAYHSSYIAAVGVAYDRLLAGALTILNDDDLSWRRPRSTMVSLVTGEPVDMTRDSLPPSYWSNNLRSRVLFNTAIHRLGTDPAF